MEDANRGGDRRLSAKPTMKLYESRSRMEQRGDTKSGRTERREDAGGEKRG